MRRSLRKSARLGDDDADTPTRPRRTRYASPRSFKDEYANLDNEFGLTEKEDMDEEFNEPEDEEEEDEYVEDETSDHEKHKGRRSRSSRHQKEEDESEKDEDEDHGESENDNDNDNDNAESGENDNDNDNDAATQRGTSVSVSAKSESENEKQIDVTSLVPVPVVPKKRGRGRPPGSGKRKALPHFDLRRKKPGRKPGYKKKIYSPFPKPLDASGHEIPLKPTNDEYDMPNDPVGDTKIDENGHLKDGRDFRVRTFTVAGKGEKLYMLSTEPARCLGYRDAYYLFLKHPSLYKFVLSEDEKQDLVDRGIIPNSYKSRTIGLVTARSIYKEFGAKIVIGGKQVTDDYWAEKEKEMGAVEGELAVPDDHVPANKEDYDKKRYIAWHGGSQIYQQQMASSFGPEFGSGSIPVPVLPGLYEFPMHKEFSVKSNVIKEHVTDENWIFQHCQMSLLFNKELVRQRRDLYKRKRGIKDVYTGIGFYPLVTQPTQCTWYRKDPPAAETGTNRIFPDINMSNWAGINGCAKFKNQLVYETVLESASMFRNTGLKDVAEDVFVDCVSDEVKEAILKQRGYEG